MDRQKELQLRGMVDHCPDGADEDCHCDCYRCGDVKAVFGELDRLRAMVARMQAVFHEYVVDEVP